MNIQKEFESYISSLPETKQSELLELHKLILSINPDCKLWFFDGKNSEGMIVSNPSIGYGKYTMDYASGETKEFYRVGLSANKSGISVYILGIKDKKYLVNTYATKLGKASVTGYCIKFKTLKDINLDVLESALQYGFNYQNE